jgi:hypothetical protein
MDKLIPIQHRHLHIKHKIINEQPHIEVQAFDERYSPIVPRDTMTLLPTQNELLHKTIEAWLYE